MGLGDRPPGGRNPTRRVRGIYALLVLGDVDDDLDYIPGRRGKVRGDGPENPVADPTDPGASDGDDPQFPS
ncbi:hypothetical protein BRC99_07275 [Halobacteriales archaeon QS_7_69_60]|nr:MAG: hypothetical protein BRC99_07275 [Halobacteriales archaeon QS_7_69_60]